MNWAILLMTRITTLFRSIKKKAKESKRSKEERSERQKSRGGTTFKHKNCLQILPSACSWPNFRSCSSLERLLVMIHHGRIKLKCCLSTKKKIKGRRSLTSSCCCISWLSIESSSTKLSSHVLGNPSEDQNSKNSIMQIKKEKRKQKKQEGEKVKGRSQRAASLLNTKTVSKFCLICSWLNFRRSDFQHNKQKLACKHSA